MTGRVLSEEDVQMIDKHIHGVSEDEQQLVLNLIATIRDREEMVGSWRRVCEKLEQQNTILREALERVDDESLKSVIARIEIAREALAKVGESK